MLKPEDVDELKELQQSIKKSLDLFQQCVMFPPEDLHPGMYETMNHWLDTIGRDVFNLYLTLAKFQEFPLLKEQAELVIKKAEEYGYTEQNLSKIMFTGRNANALWSFIFAYLL